MTFATSKDYETRELTLDEVVISENAEDHWENQPHHLEKGEKILRDRGEIEDTLVGVEYEGEVVVIDGVWRVIAGRNVDGVETVEVALVDPTTLDPMTCIKHGVVPDDHPQFSDADGESAVEENTENRSLDEFSD